jgi:hypothetical protein
MTTDNSRLETAISLLRQCKADGKSYFEATQTLVQQGYSQLEIEQASYQFPYSNIGAGGDKVPQDLSRQPVDGKNIDDESKLLEAKDKLNRDYWYSFIPIVGSFFKTKRIGDYIEFGALKTGRSRLTATTIWVAAMIIGAFVTLVVAPRVVGLFSKNSTALYLSHYIGLILTIFLLMFIFRAKKSS